MRCGIIVAASLLFGPALAWAAPPGPVSMTPEQQKTVGLQTARAVREEITQPVRLPGTVTFDPGHVAVLRPIEQARVSRLLVQPGDVVAARQPLAELDMPGLADQQQNLFAAQAAVREADAGVAVAKAALERAVILARDGSLARAEADRRRLVLAQAVAAQQTARARVGMLEAMVARLNPIRGIDGLAALTSPIGGIVIASGLTPGEVVGPNTEALTVADLHSVMVLAQVPEAAATEITVSDAAQVGIAGSQRHWDGRVATLGAQLDPQSRTLPARILIANPDLTLRAGMYVDVVITRTLNRESVVVPAAAVQLVADKHVVFTPQADDKFQSHEVQIGVERQDTVEVSGGLKAGDIVVTQGSFQLKALLLAAMLSGG